VFELGAGGAVGGMGSMVGAITGSIGKFFGAKDPLTQLKKFSEAKINVEQAKKNANAMVAYAKAMAAGGGATAVQGLGAFVGGIAGSIGKFFGGKDAVDPLTQLKRFGETAVNAANIKSNALAMKDYAALTAVSPNFFNYVKGSTASFPPKNLPIEPAIPPTNAPRPCTAVAPPPAAIALAYATIALAFFFACSTLI
jgi:hypothetical protein